MNLILDTSIVIEIEKRNIEVIKKLKELRKLYPSPPKISFISYFEFLYGIRNKSIKNKEKSLIFLNNLEVLHTTNRTADILVLLKEKYELSLADLFIASQVLEDKGILVTKDKDFSSISEIRKVLL